MLCHNLLNLPVLNEKDWRNTKPHKHLVTEQSDIPFQRRFQVFKTSMYHIRQGNEITNVEIIDALTRT